MYVSVYRHLSKLILLHIHRVAGVKYTCSFAASSNVRKRLHLFFWNPNEILNDHCLGLNTANFNGG